MMFITVIKLLCCTLTGGMSAKPTAGSTEKFDQDDFLDGGIRTYLVLPREPGGRLQLCSQVENSCHTPSGWSLYVVVSGEFRVPSNTKRGMGEAHEEHMQPRVIWPKQNEISAGT